MHTHHRVLATAAMGALGCLGAAGPSSAQLAHASAATLGAAGNATATARRFAAISLNPAGLGMPGSGFSLALVPIQVRQGLGPIGLADLADYEGVVVPASTKEDWLSRVAAQGGQSGSIGVDVSGFALTAGRIGLQVSTVVGVNMNLAPDIVEAMLYGNAGRTGRPADLSLSGSSVDAFAMTTAALSFGVPIEAQTGSLAVGATLKYVVGHGVAVGRDQGGSVSSDPLRVNIDFPMLMPDDEDYSANGGAGFGLDVGFQMKRDRVSFGAAVLNVVNTLSWDAAALVYRPGTALLAEADNATDFDKQPYSAAPAALKQIVDDMKLDPIVTVGGAYDVNPDFTVAADLRNRFGDGIDLGPKLHAGVGAEYRGLGFLHVRGGGAVVTDGVELATGASLVLGPVNLSAAWALRNGDVEDTNIGQFTLSFAGR